jgi:hypothetical protein
MGRVETGEPNEAKKHSSGPEEAPGIDEVWPMKRLAVLFAMVALLVPGVFSSVAGAAGPEIFTASLNGASEHPGVQTVGGGDAQIVINAAGTAVTYNVNYFNLSGPVVAGHIHFGSIDANGPVMLPFVVGPSPINGILTAANFQATPQASTFAAALEAIRSGNAYVNLHTADHPGGEIRGQLSVSRSLAFYGGSFRGANENPAVTTGGAGTAQLLIDELGQTIQFRIDYTGLSGPVVAAHIHFGAPGVNGPIMIPFKVTTSPMIGTLSSANFLTTEPAPFWADAIAAIRSGKAYVNLHTAAHPGGEVRANLTSQ